MPVDIFPQVGDPPSMWRSRTAAWTRPRWKATLTYYYEYHFLYITGIDHVESKSIQGAALMKLVFHEGTEHEPGDVRNRRLREPRPRLHAAGNRAALHHAFRRRQRGRRPCWSSAAPRARKARCRISRSTACARCSQRCRRFRAAALRRKPADHRRHARSGQAPAVPISPEEAIAAVEQSHAGDAVGQHVDRQDRAHRPDQRRAWAANLSVARTPIRPVSGATVYLRDIGTIENGTDIVTAYAHVNGKRTVYIPVTKRSDASTLAVINAVKAAIPDFKKAVPERCRREPRIRPVAVRHQLAARPGDRRIARRGSHRPDGADLPARLAQRADRRPEYPVRLLTAVILLWAAGQTINIMTLGGLALAVGVLVDEATVEIENIHSQMLPGVSRARAVVEACSRTAMARLLSMFCILAVFVPSFFMIGVGRQLFVPLSLAVAFSMIASYLLSSSLVPVFSTWLMREAHRGEEREGFFGHLRSFYERYLNGVCGSAGRWQLVYLAPRSGSSICCCRAWERSCSPTPTLRCCASGCARRPAPASRRPSASSCARSMSFVATPAPDNVEITSDFVGVVPSSYPVDLIHLFTSGPQEAIIQVALKPGAARRSRCANGCAKPAPRVARHASLFRGRRHRHQVMSFGLATPIEVAVQGVSLQNDYAYAQKVQAQMAKLSFLRDLQFAQENNYPTLDINIDRERAGQFGLTMADVVRTRWSPPPPPRASPIPTTGAIRIPATPSRFKWSCPKTACRASNRSAIFR
jgi:hypothetical protein